MRLVGFSRVLSVVVVCLATHLGSAAPASADTLELSDTTWRFVEILGSAPAAGAEPNITFSRGGDATGQAGCNEFSGRYDVANEALVFSELGYTKSACAPELMRTDMAVQTVLNRTRDGIVTPQGELRLVGSDGALVARLVPMSTPAAHVGRLYYDIVVRLPGTRSQGWTATLYGRGGAPVTAPAGQPVTTALGDFVDVPCGVPWEDCGMVRTDMLRWMKTHDAHVFMDMKPWTYRLYVDAEGTESEVWTSVLLHDGAEIPPAADPVQTPMGLFGTAGAGAVGWARAGWLPVSWLEHPPTTPR